MKTALMAALAAHDARTSDDEPNEENPERGTGIFSCVGHASGLEPEELCYFDGGRRGRRCDIRIRATQDERETAPDSRRLMRGADCGGSPCSRAAGHRDRCDPEGTDPPPKGTRVAGHKLELTPGTERSRAERSSTGRCLCGWEESHSTQKGVREEYALHLKQVRR